MNSSLDELKSLARTVVDMARQNGVDVAEVSAGQGWELSAKVRLGEVELVEEAGHKSLSLRVRRDDKVAASATSDLRPEGLRQCVQYAAELLELSEPDPDSRPADTSDLCRNTEGDLNLYDETLEQLEDVRDPERACEAGAENPQSFGEIQESSSKAMRASSAPDAPRVNRAMLV